MNRDKRTKLDKLFKEFSAMSPKERNEKLQALFASRLMSLGEEEGGAIMSIDLLKALMKSFGISVKYAELEGLNGGDLFPTKETDIRDLRRDRMDTDDSPERTIVKKRPVKKKVPPRRIVKKRT